MSITTDVLAYTRHIFTLPFWKSKLFACIASAIIGAIAVSVYDAYSTKLHLERHLRATDSLRIEISHKDKEYLLLKTKADSLDNAILTAKGKVVTVTKSFPAFKRPDILSSDSAAVYLREFIYE